MLLTENYCATSGSYVFAGFPYVAVRWLRGALRRADRTLYDVVWHFFEICGARLYHHVFLLSFPQPGRKGLPFKALTTGASSVTCFAYSGIASESFA